MCQKERWMRNIATAVIYDMDGVIVDSEPLWKKAEIKVFKTVGIELDDNLCNQTKGLRIDEAVEYWYRRYPWERYSVKEIENAVLDEFMHLIQSSQLMRGVVASLELIQLLGWEIGLASSSPMRLIEYIVGTFNIRPYFKALCSAENEAYGKPHPAVYLSCARILGVEAKKCIAIEDSVNGMISALAASMKVIAVPEKVEYQDQRFAVANRKLHTLDEIDQRLLLQLEAHG